MAAFILGLIIGALCGVFTMSLCVVARDADDREDQIHDSERS